jgi:probable F420-dependent oxidoreductase
LTTLAYIAGATTRLRLVTGVLILPERNPVLFAKQAATLDALSGGRLQLGVGLGWLREEYEALGLPWERRGQRMDETIEAMRVLWSEEVASFAGELVSFQGVRCDPKPVQPGGVPLLVGGHSPSAARRAGRLGDGFVPTGSGGADFDALVGEMRQAASQAGRDPDNIGVYAGCDGTPAALEALAARGVAGVFIASSPTDIDAARAWLDQLASSALPAVR